jgi:predicted O-methyltransferase YrrM
MTKPMRRTLRRLADLKRMPERIAAYGACLWWLRHAGRDTHRGHAVEAVYSASARFIRPTQERTEIETLMGILAKGKPRCVVEIGTASGGSLFLFTRVASFEATLVSIDLPGGEFGGGYGRWRAPLYRSFARAGQTIHLLRADSHARETRERLESILDGRRIDLLFIDGDHSCEGVKRDFEMYRELVIPGGIIAFHDIVPCTRDTRCEVDRFWNDIKHQYDHQEIVNNWNQGYAGIGAIRWPAAGR